MERNVTMAEISDGKLYSRDDMVKAGCDDCRGCSACCHGMGNSIVLDPYDVYRLTALRGDTLEHLALRYLGDASLWPALQSHNRVASPYRLQPGSILEIPRQLLRAATAPALPR